MQKQPSPAAEPVPEENHLRRVNAGTFSETTELPDGWTLTTLFNLSANQQKDILTREGEKPAVTVTPLDPALREKLEGLVKKEADAKRPPHKGYDKLNNVLS
jgi:hypothetical protein